MAGQDDSGAGPVESRGRGGQEGGVTARVQVVPRADKVDRFSIVNAEGDVVTFKVLPVRRSRIAQRRCAAAAAAGRMRAADAAGCAASASASLRCAHLVRAAAGRACCCLAACTLAMLNPLHAAA